MLFGGSIRFSTAALRSGEYATSSSYPAHLRNRGKVEQRTTSLTQGALDQAAPLAGWDLPEEFATLRRLMEARMIKAGRREYVQVLRLLETFEMADLQVAVKNALRMGAIGFDAVKHLVLCQVEKRPPKLDLDVYPYLPKANVGTTSVASYMSLMRGRAA